MRRRGLLLMLVLTFASISTAQTGKRERPKLQWSESPTCASAGPVVALCQRTEADGMVFRIAEYRGITYAMTFRLSRGFVIASVQLSNHTGGRVKIKPLRSKLLRFAEEADLASARKPVDAEKSLSDDELRIVKFVPRPTAEEQEGGIRPGLQVNSVYEERMTRNGRVISGPRMEPKPPPSEKPEPTSTSVGVAVPRGVFDFLLRPRTLQDEEKAAGHIVFKADEHPGYFVFLMDAGTFDLLVPVGDLFAVARGRSN